MASPPLSQIVWDDVLGIAPELSTITASGRVDILAYVNSLTSGTAPVLYTPDEMVVVANDPGNGLDAGNDGGATLRFARILMAAHFGTIAKRAGSGAAGPVTSQAAGGLRVSYGLTSISSGDPGFSLTQYGQTYLTLVRSSLAHGPVLC